MPAVKGDGMRGLAVFISDIRNCKSKEAELKRINKELANIRSKFKGEKTLDGYQKKKYVCKLLFIFLLGHDIDFGHMEAVNLLSSNKYTEKQIGYLFISVLVGGGSDLTKLVVQSVRNDLASRNPVHVNLALQCIANIGGREMADAFAAELPRLLVSGDTIDFVKQSAALCLLRVFRSFADFVPAADYASRIVHLLNDQHMGVVTAACSLIDALAKKYPVEYKGAVSLAISRLSRIVTSVYTDLQDYTYYFVPGPWLSVKLLRLLQNYPAPEEPANRARLIECLEQILNKAQEAPKSKKVQHANAKHAVLLEAIALIIHLDTEPQLLVRACNQLGAFLNHRETNLRYLALESMCLLATSEHSRDAVKKHQETVVAALKGERDVSVRQRAVDLLYAMCDRSNAKEIVREMLQYLETADYSIREEMVLKVAILAEKYAQDYQWYVDVILKLIWVAGDYVGEEVWYRVIQIVINREEVQGYAAKMVFEALQAPACHENMVKVGGYILGEFGNLIAGDSRSSPMVQFELLHAKYHLCSIATRALLLSTYVKFVNLFPEIKDKIQEVLSQSSNLRNPDAELQQRAAEYLKLSQVAATDLLATVLEEMPPFVEKESSLLSKLRQSRPRVDGVETANEDKERKKQMPNAVLADTFATQSSGGGAAAPSVTGGGGGGTADLLGLNVSGDMGNDAQQATSNGFMPAPSAVAGQTNGTVDVVQMKHEDLRKFVVKNSGVIFENNVIQIGCKLESRLNLARIGMYYGNKTASSLTNFAPSVQPPLSGADLTYQLVIQAKPVDPVVDGGAQVQQLINVECLADYYELPTLRVSFIHNGSPVVVSFELPLFINKFFEPTEMTSEDFFQRWKKLSQPVQECQKIFSARNPMDAEQIRTKLTGFGVRVLPGVDPNADNFVAAGIVHTKAAQIGTLLRLEPNRQAKMYRLTVRSSNGQTAKYLCENLHEHF